MSSGTLFGPGTILGGLPVIAEVVFGYDSWNGEGYAEVENIFWMKRNGERGKQIPQHLFDKAEKYDPYFSCLSEAVSDHHAMKAYNDEGDDDE